MAISAKLVQLMGGQLGLQSKLGEGSDFYFSLLVGVEPVAAAAAPAGFQGKRVLILEDNAVAGGCLQRQLEGMGLQVSLMLNPAAAIDAISRSRTVNFPFDFIFADADMAAPAGVAFAEAWKAAGGPESLLMLLTTESQRAELARLRALGVSAHLVKPVGADDARDPRQPGRRRGDGQGCHPPPPPGLRPRLGGRGHRRGDAHLRGFPVSRGTPTTRSRSWRRTWRRGRCRCCTWRT